ncbi:MAG: hypothetical protein IJ978_01170 [Clostridia bacterium]|nr:hypothetical protein [Clostridia bacterium]
MKLFSKKDRLGNMSVSQFAQYLKQVEKRDFIIKTALKVLLVAVLFQFVFMPLTGFLPRVEEGWTVDSTNPHICFQNGAKISAHRAGGDLAPEETMSAFKLCVEATEYEVDILEFDLHMTKDGQLVLMHDDTVNRTSNATEHFGDKSVYVKDKTLAELKELNFGENYEALDGSYPYRGLRGDDIPEDVKILTLDEILTYLKGKDLDYIIEIKDGGELGKRAMDKLYDTMVEYDILDRTIVGTFQGNVTKYIDEKYPDVTRSASIVEVLGFYFAFLYRIEEVNFDFDVLQIPQGFKGFFDLGAKTCIVYGRNVVQSNTLPISFRIVCHSESDFGFGAYYVSTSPYHYLFHSNQKITHYEQDNQTNLEPATYECLDIHRNHHCRILSLDSD